MTIYTENLPVCSACGSEDLEEIVELKSFPHIGIYLKNKEDSSTYPEIDNSLNCCANCGHIQLGFTVDPKFLYTPSFQHKTSTSASAMQANNFLYDFARDISGTESPKVVAEIGCNDTFLLQKFATDGSIVVGVDPILRDKESEFLEDVPSQLAPKFRVAGDFIENVDFDSTLGVTPDLFVTNFVFEHLRDPFAVTQSIIEKMHPNAKMIIGVPGAEFLVMNSRFDQLSHQHYQQFTIHSLTKMVERAGGEVIDLKVNFSNWGQILIGFRKAQTNQNTVGNNSTFSPAQVKHSFRMFQESLIALKKRLDFLQSKEIYGFGAAQNFPILSYFYGEQFPFKTILDDHPLRQDSHFPHLDYTITKPRESYYGAVGVITGPDYSRVLVPRMSELKFDHIIIPFSGN